MFAKKKVIKPFEKKVYLSSPTMHGDELKYMKEAFETNWMSTIGENINEVESIAAAEAGVKYAVALCNCTSALHLCCKVAGEKLYGKPAIGHGALEGKRVFCSDMTFDATVNPVVYEGGIPVFIDTDYASWNMDPIALEKAFELYPDVKLVVFAELYGFPGRVDLIKKICEEHGALLIEDAAEAMGATLNGKKCGSFGDFGAISYNGNKIITGSSGGCLLTDDIEVANAIRKWSTQARENAPWYQHKELGYNYRMSNVIAGVIRGQYPFLEQHITQKKAIYERYKEGLKGLPIQMNPIIDNTKPNYWLSALVVEKEYMCKQVRGDLKVSYVPEKGKTCPTEILDAISSINAEGRPIWKPMHMQPIYKESEFVGREGFVKHNGITDATKKMVDIGADIFNRGCCLPSDNKMTIEEQDRIIEAIRGCFE
ncbi:MAG: DegT/DnrJ/EryC1/StrS family aminotransferase [Bacilli bacterium]|nr:DegT/DnrJ/EryC1/StrS family aminotransferase [Bacilli bacterium]